MSCKKQMPTGKFTTVPKFSRGQYVMPVSPFRVVVPKDKDLGDVVVRLPGREHSNIFREGDLRPATPDELRAAGLTARLGDVEDMT